MAAIEDLIQQVADPGLREQLASEVARLKATKKFGLVFEEHLPELVRLPSLPVRNGVRVVKKDDNRGTTYRVLSTINGQRIKIAPEAGGAEEIVERGSVVVAKAFGEPMYPALVPVDAVERAPGKPWHVLINADNYHALQLLLYGYEGKVDVIYIDPPYNTGARDWKYNNNYVDKTDQFRHSKWLSMMKKRLVLAQRLLKPEGVLICAIDDYEYAHLSCLLDQCWGSTLALGTVVVRNKPQGRATTTGLSVQHEYLLFYGASDRARIREITKTAKQKGRYSQSDTDGLFTWENFRKSGQGCKRGDRPRQFYPIYRAPGDTILIPEMQWEEAAKTWIVTDKRVKNLEAIFPVTVDGEERVWKWSPERAREELSEFRLVLTGDKVEVQKKLRMERETNLPFTVWDEPEMSATDYGVKDIVACFDDKDIFPFPKSKYAVRKAILTATASRRAIVVDFFAGSGTTQQAVSMLNSEDGGSRRTILVTNNEVSASAASTLAAVDAEPGNSDYERKGICNAVTWPRIKFVTEGKRADGKRLVGSDLDSRQMSDGFEENAAYFRLDFLDPADVTRGEKFESIVPILWMLAGCRGACELSKGGGKWFIPKANPFAVLLKEDAFIEFQAKLAERPDIDHAFLVTDSTEAFHELATDLGRGYKSFQLYRSYIDTFRINLTEPGTITPGGVPANPLSVAPLAPLAQEVGGAV